MTAAAGPARPAGGEDAAERPSTSSPPIDDDVTAGAPPASDGASDDDPTRGSAASSAGRGVEHSPDDDDDAPLPPAQVVAAYEVTEKGAGGGAGARPKGPELVDDVETPAPPDLLHDDSIEKGSMKTAALTDTMMVDNLAPPIPLNFANLEAGKSKVAPAASQNTVGSFDRTGDIHSRIMAKSRAGGGPSTSTASSELQPRGISGPSDNPGDDMSQRTPAAAAMPAIRPPPPSMLPRDPSESERAESPVPLFHPVEAHRVEDEPEQPVYDAIPLGEEPWAKRHQKKIIGGCALTIVALVIALGVAFGTGGNDAPQSVLLVASASPSHSASPSFPPTGSLSPSGQPTMYPRRCFADRNELKAAVDDYTAGGFSCMSGESTCEVIQTYGWPIGTWCVSNVTDMSELFSLKLAFQDDLSLWDTSKVTSMSFMFNGASSFNGGVSKWDTSSVTDMAYMFQGASLFDGDVSNWNTSSVTDMSFLFSFASSFDGDVSNWNTSSVTSMRWMFYGASSFNRNVSNWATSSVADMDYMFYLATAFNQNLCAWNDAFPYDAAEGNAFLFSSEAIFSNSGCTFQDTPQLTQKGPFCASTCT